jgi:Lar family restriction alleviation protein
MNEPERCPFCGSEVKVHIGVLRGLTMIVCPACRATVSFGGQESARATINAWNRRADNAQ